MMDSDSFVNNMQSDFNIMSDKEKVKLELAQTKKNISKLKETINKNEKYKKIN